MKRTGRQPVSRERYATTTSGTRLLIGVTRTSQSGHRAGYGAAFQPGRNRDLRTFGAGRDNERGTKNVPIETEQAYGARSVGSFRRRKCARAFGGTRAITGDYIVALFRSNASVFA